MRALFEDRAFAAADADITISEVVLPLTSSRRDLWFKILEDEFGSISIKAWATRALAWAATDATTGYLASATVVPPTGISSTIMTDNATTDPDLTNLTLRGLFADAPAAGGVVWGYTCAPDIVVCENIVQRLRTYRGSGKALAAINEDGGILLATGESPGSFPAIRVYSLPANQRTSIANASLSTIDYAIRVEIGCEALGEPFTVWRRCRELQAAVESILLDENRTSYGEVLTLERVGVGSPAYVNATTVVAYVDLNATFHAVWSDRESPRR